MGNLSWKIGLIVLLVVVAAWTLYPPTKTLKPGIDLAGGTSLIYEIDTHGLKESETDRLAERMITVLRRRIDPAGIQNLVWRPQGNTRFEIQMPLASADAREKRQNYEKALNELLADNVNRTVILRSLQKPAEERTKDLEKFARNSPDRLKILNDLAKVYDEYQAIKNQRDALYAELQTKESAFSSAAINLDQVKERIGDWTKLTGQQLTDSLKQFPEGEANLELLSKYVETYTQWSKVVEQLTGPETGKNIQYKNAIRTIDKLNLTAEQIDSCLEMPVKSRERKETIEKLKTDFPERAGKIDKVVAAFDLYRPFRGRLDDPKDLQRMLKGSGVLEFRILPILGHPEVNADEMNTYVEALKEKGPKYASDNKYVWCEIETIKEWKLPNSIVSQFGNKSYVLTSNKENEALLHSGESQKAWKLEGARPSHDEMGRRAIGFTLDEKGGGLFANITGKNIDRPLCILLDGIAISAPNIQSRIHREGVITGNYTQTEQDDMVNKLNAGSLPARLVEQPISIRTIGPSIGADNRDQGIKAGLIGLAGVISCMAIYYTLGGAIADAALLMNLLFTLAIMALLNATFTLPGIAGAILTIGMSVDANVLIFERIREEQQRGSSLSIAIKNGYQKAFSAIFDSNLTTILTAAILYWVGSEEIKGFAIVLMLGLASSMFTALFVTRVIFDLLLRKRLIKDRLLMMHLIRKPNINWMSFRPVFFTLSGVLTIGGLAIFFTRDNTRSNKYDIEFTGGTSVQITLKDDAPLTRSDVEDRLHKVAAEMNNSPLGAANVYSIGDSGRQYEINTMETNKTITTVTFPLLSSVEDRKGGGSWGVDTIISAIKKAQGQFNRSLSNLLVTPAPLSSVEDRKGGSGPQFTIATSQLNPSLVKGVLTAAFPDANVSEPRVDEVVNNAILRAFANELRIQQSLQPKITAQEKITESGPGGVESHPELAEFLGGIKITCELQRPATAEEIDQRIRDLRFKPDMRELNWYSYKLFWPEPTATEPNRADSLRRIKTFVYASADPEAGFRELNEEEWTRFVQNETTKVLAATQLETSLPQVRQFDSSVGAETKTRALIAILLSLAAMLIYIWVRFGNLRYGVGAIITLAHDTCVTLGAVTGCTYIAATGLGARLLIGDFKIDLAMIAAFLTLLGYSINDTIVVYDRIREKYKKGALTAAVITNSINETLSRTLLTGVTTLLVVFVMYVFGGKGLRGFNFAMLFGIVIGTYSSIAISAPILLVGAKEKKE
jgi:SecD/SecF fusion protein